MIDLFQQAVSAEARERSDAAFVQPTHISNGNHASKDWRACLHSCQSTRIEQDLSHRGTTTSKGDQY